MKGIVSIVAAVAASTFLFAAGAASAATPTDLYFSGHIEGSSYNKALEIYNGTGAAVDLSQYTVELYTNGHSDVNTTVTLAGTLGAGDVYVIANSQAAPAILALADLQSGVTNFNGDDVELLKHNGTIIDSFGQFGVDPGSTWGTTVQSKDHTLSRKPAVCAGDTNDSDAFDPATEWDASAKDDITGLGSYTANCGGPTPITVSVDDVGHQEGDSGTTNYDFVVTLSSAESVGHPVTFTVATADVTATAGTDYTALPATASSISAGQTTKTFTIAVNGDTTIEPDETFTFNVTGISGLNVTATATSATGTIYNDDAVDAAIWQIQGTPAPASSITQGADGASPYVGDLVHTCGIVTVAVAGSGFYMQSSDSAVAGDPLCDADTDPLTSNGVYVYDTGDAVASGDLIDLNAEVSEYYGMTELSFVNINTQTSGTTLPAAVEFGATTPSSNPSALSCGDTNFECYEGMLVHIANGFVTQGSGYSSKHTYDYLYVTANGQRSLRGPGLLYGLAHAASSDNAASPVWDGNPEVFELEPNEFAGVNDDQTPVTGGSSFTATGVIGYDFGSYAFYPSVFTVTNAAPMPRPVPDATDPSILRVGEFNVERFCDDISDVYDPAPGSTAPIPPGKELYECSGNYNDLPPTTAEYDLKTQRVADYIGTVLDLPDVVALEEVENIDVLTKLADNLNATYGMAPYAIHYVPELMEGNGLSGIDVAYLVNTNRVQIFSVQQLDKDLMYQTPISTNYPTSYTDPVFDRVPLLLQGIFTGGGQNQPFMVLVNHLKARQNVDDYFESGKPGEVARRDQEKRFREAYALAQLVQNLQSTYSTQGLRLGTLAPNAASMRTPLLVVGDFNAYQFTDGFADLTGMVGGCYNFDGNLWDPSDLTKWNLQPASFPDENVVSPTLWNAIYSLPPNERYSYLYSPDLGAIQGYGIGGEGSREVPTDQGIDQALLDKAAQNLFLRMDFGRADEDAASEDEFNSTGAIGVSDHDGFVIQLDTDRIFASGFENRGCHNDYYLQPTP